MGAITSTGPRVSLEFAPIGDPGNVGEWSGAAADGSGPSRMCGAVNYPYELGRFEVSAGQYTEFLNAVAATDPYGLYDEQMTTSYGCQIQRTGNSGSFAYSVASDWANRPANFVSWGDAARFANWLGNGQPTGPQGPSTTEDGSYLLNGAMTDQELTAVQRAPDAVYALPTEDEWYKAAYFKGPTLRDTYWEYPTASDTVPLNNVTDPDPGNNANFYRFGYTLADPYWRTPVGEFENSATVYGTFDQGGNVWEWTEEVILDTKRNVRGGSFFYGEEYMRANYRVGISPSTASSVSGFRIARVPEPTTIVLLFFVAAGRFGRQRQ
jgi:formylglycine-generating enzyme required for sulfatase activity